MEPLGAAASIIGIINVAISMTAALVKYANDTKSASSDRRSLFEEAGVLCRLLERIRDRARAAHHDDTWLADHGNVVRQFEVALEDLALLLDYDTASGKVKRHSRFKTVRILSTWSFNKSEIYSLLERITRLQQYANLLLSDDHYTLLERMDQKQQEALDQKLKAEILSWLCPLHMSQVHRIVSDRAQKGTGEWFLVSEEFTTWLENTGSSLWCWGIPGAGKTILASIIVNHLRQIRAEADKKSVGIAVIYLKYNDPLQTLDNILAGLLEQLVQELDSVPSPLLDLYDRHRERKTSPMLDETARTLCDTMKSYTKAYFVVDGLDEVGEELRWGPIEKLEDLQPNLHLLITSRYLDRIDEELTSFNSYEVKAHGVDIELYLDHQIRKNRNPRKMVERSPTLRDDIARGVVETAKKMYINFWRDPRQPG